MSAKMKENGYRVPGQTDSVAESIVQDASKKVCVSYMLLRQVDIWPNISIVAAES